MNNLVKCTAHVIKTSDLGLTNGQVRLRSKVKLKYQKMGKIVENNFTVTGKQSKLHQRLIQTLKHS